MDLRARRKLAFVVERYGAEESTESGRRTRALAAAVAARGHDVSVLTTCTRLPGEWRNELAQGESFLDGVRVVRFPTETERSVLGRHLSSRTWLARHPWGRDVWLDAVGPASPAMVQYLHRLGALFDAVLFTGAWGPLPMRGARLVQTPILAPPPMDDPMRTLGHVPELLRGFRALALESDAQRDRLASEAGIAEQCDTFVIGACCEPLPSRARPFDVAQPVTDPFILYVGDNGSHVRRLVEAFRLFRDAHALTPFEDDVDDTFEGQDLRLILAGDFEHVHAPEDRVVSLGPVDDAVRHALLRKALVVVHCDARMQLPVSLIEAWSLGRPTLTLDAHPLLRASLKSWASEYVCDHFAFASCAAALLSKRGPRAALAARALDHARRTYDPGRVVTAVEACIDALRAPAVS